MVINFLDRQSSINILLHKVTTNCISLRCEYRFLHFNVEIYKNNNAGYIPKGSAYVLNEYGEYVSDCIILNKIENA